MCEDWKEVIKKKIDTGKRRENNNFIIIFILDNNLTVDKPYLIKLITIKIKRTYFIFKY